MVFGNGVSTEIDQGALQLLMIKTDEMLWCGQQPPSAISAIESELLKTAQRPKELVPSLLCRGAGYGPPPPTPWNHVNYVCRSHQFDQAANTKDPAVSRLWV